MKKTTKTLAILGILIAMVGLSACGDTGAAKKTKTEHLSFGAISSIDCMPMVIAQEKGYFKKNGIDMDLQFFTSAKSRDAALQGNALDGVIADTVAISIYQNSGRDMKIVSTTTGEFSVVVSKNANIKTLADLKNKKVAISKNTLIDYLSDTLAEEGGIPTTSLDKVIIPPLPERLTALNSGQIDVAILPAPFDVMALKSGNTIIKTIKNKDAEISVISFDNAYLTKHHDQAVAFIKSYNEGVEYLNTHPISQYEDLLIKTIGYSKNSKGSLKLPKFEKAKLPQEKNVDRVFTWSYKAGITSKKINANDVMVDLK